MVSLVLKRTSTGKVEGDELAYIFIKNVNDEFVNMHVLVEKNKADETCLQLSSLSSEIALQVEINNHVKAKYINGKRTTWMEKNYKAYDSWNENQKQSFVMYDSVNETYH